MSFREEVLHLSTQERQQYFFEQAQKTDIPLTNTYKMFIAMPFYKIL